MGSRARFFALVALALSGCAPTAPQPFGGAGGDAGLSGYDASSYMPDAGIRTAPGPDGSLGVQPEICGNGVDEDRNGIVDDNCQCRTGMTQACRIGTPAQDNIGVCRAGMQTCMATGGEWGVWTPCNGAVGPTVEVCSNAVDEDCNGVADDGASCACTANQACYSGPPTTRMVGACRDGMQTCTGGVLGACMGEVAPAAAEVCGNMIDDNCNAQVDEGCPVAVNVSVTLTTDCASVSCPPEAPFPVGCAITMDGDDTRGCVASYPTNSTVYFKEGDACPIFGFGAGNVTGVLRCSSVPGTGLNATNCPINKPTPLYVIDANDCPG